MPSSDFSFKTYSSSAADRTVMGQGVIDHEEIFRLEERKHLKRIAGVEDKIVVSQQAINTYNNIFRQKLEEMRDSLKVIAEGQFSQLDAVTGEKKRSIFEHKKITAETNNTKEADYYCRMEYTGTSNNAVSYDNEAYDFQILQIATKHSLQTIKFNSNTANITQEVVELNNGKLNCGIFQINNVSIAIDSGDSLNKLKQKINDANANVEAYVNKINTQYRLEVKSTIFGTAGMVNISDSENILNNAFGNLTAPAGENLRTVAQDAQLCFLGSTDVYSFSNNKITEFIDGLTINIFRPTQNDVIHVEIDTSTEEVYQSIVDFAEAYNDFVDFVSAQQKREKKQKRGDHGEITEYIKGAEGSHLYKNQILLDMFERLNMEMSFYTSPKSDGGTLLSIAGMGQSKLQTNSDENLNPYSRYKLQVDHAYLANFLENNFDLAKNILNSYAASNSTDFELGRIGPFFGIGNFTIDINLTDTLNATSHLSMYDYGSMSITKIPLDVWAYNESDATEGGIINYNGEDPYFKGLTLLYNGNNIVDYASFDTNYGLADHLIAIIDNALEKDSVIDQGKKELEEKLEDLSRKRERIERDLLLLEKKKLNSLRKEERITKANTIRQHLILTQDAAYSRK
jgi:hypothetical protein